MLWKLGLVKTQTSFCLQVIVLSQSVRYNFLIVVDARNPQQYLVFHLLQVLLICSVLLSIDT